MSWTGVAIGVGSIAGSLLSGGGGSGAGDTATYISLVQQQKEWDYMLERQAEWDDIFGGTQAVLSDYYENLTADSVASKNVQAIQTGYQNYEKQLDKQLAQRGIDQSGLAASLTSQNLYNVEQAKATARVDAPQEVAQQKSAWLSLGLGDSTLLQQNAANQLSSNTAAARDRASIATNNDRADQAAADSSISNSLGQIGKAIGNYVSTPSTSSFPTVSNELLASL